MSSSGFTINRKGWDELMKVVHSARDNQQLVAVGIQGEKASEPHRPPVERASGRGKRGVMIGPMAQTETTNVLIGGVHEFGTMNGRVPERSFIRSTMHAQEVKIKGWCAALMKQVVELKITVPNALGKLGELLTAEMKRTIRAGIPPALKQETIDRKGSSKPLIDTGQLLNSITYEVRK
jgi:phage gpG-like protein